MKTTINLFLALLIFQAGAKAQIDPIGEYQANQSNMVLVDDNLVKIYAGDYNDPTFTLYNLDNSIYREIDVPQTDITGNYFVYYISRSLFDCDTTTIEYVVYHSEMSQMEGVDNRWVRVYREDGTELLYANNALIYGTPTSHSIENTGWIQNSDIGAILKIGITDNMNPTPSTHRYYQLCGSVPVMNRSGELGDLTGLWEVGSGSDNGFVIYPNPTNLGVIQFDVEEDLNGMEGTVRLFTMSGQLIQETQLNSHVSFQSIDISELAVGTYLLNIQLENGNIISEKLVKL